MTRLTWITKTTMKNMINTKTKTKTKKATLEKRKDKQCVYDEIVNSRNMHMDSDVDNDHCMQSKIAVI